MRRLMIAATLTLAACSQVQVTVPNPRLEIPELRGDSGLALTAGVGGAHVYSATRDGSDRPPEMAEPTALGAFDLYGGAHYSSGAPVQVGIEINGIDGYGGSGILKFQFAGEGTHGADVGNMPALVYLRAGGVYGHKEGDQNGTFGAGGYNWKGVVRGAYVHAGVSMGYRLAPHALLYWGGAAGQYWINSEINQDPHPATSDAGGTYKRGDNGRAYTAGFGAEFSWTRVQFFVSAEGTSYDYKHTKAKLDPFLHAGVIITP